MRHTQKYLIFLAGLIFGILISALDIIIFIIGGVIGGFFSFISAAGLLCIRANSVNFDISSMVRNFTNSEWALIIAAGLICFFFILCLSSGKSFFLGLGICGIATTILLNIQRDE